MNSPKAPQKLPVDISDFSTLRNEDYLYVDKTEYAYNLVTRGKRYFLSRPRRFGKTLFVSMLKELLSGNRELFQGLWVETSDYSWQKYAVVHLDLSSLETMTLGSFRETLCRKLRKIAKAYKISLTPSTSPNALLDELVSSLHEVYGQVAVLIDEYDGPILRVLHSKQVETIHTSLQEFFAAVKSLEPYISFVFLTGISSFAKASVFSGLNNLQTITLDKQWAGICGYTEQELDSYFVSSITAWAHERNIPYVQLRQKIKDHYNGYRFSEAPITVYNPFSLTNALYKQNLENFWMQSGAPTFLIKELKLKKREDFNAFNSATINPESLMLSRDYLGIFDVGHVPLATLMFQTGYLTIIGYDPKDDKYQLGYPNSEVAIVLHQQLLIILTNLNPSDTEDAIHKLKSSFQSQNIEAVLEALHELFARIPYQLHAKQEKYYHALLQMACIVAGLPTHAEYSTSNGRIDMVVTLPDAIYVIEVKFNVSANKALAQIEERKYYQGFMEKGKKMILLGLAFKRKPKKFDIQYAVKELRDY